MHPGSAHRADDTPEPVRSGEISSEASVEKTADMTASSYATLDTFRRDDSGFIYIGYDMADGQFTDEGNWKTDSADIVLNNTVEGAAFTAVHAAGEGSDSTISGGQMKLFVGAKYSLSIETDDAFEASGSTIRFTLDRADPGNTGVVYVNGVLIEGTGVHDCGGVVINVND